MTTSTPKRSTTSLRHRQIADVLDGAWDILDSEGWAKGAEAVAASSQPDGPCCLGVAICRSAKERGLAKVLKPALASVSRQVRDSIPRWNDRQTSPIRVMRVLERVADAHRIQAQGVTHDING